MPSTQAMAAFGYLPASRRTRVSSLSCAVSLVRTACARRAASRGGRLLSRRGTSCRHLEQYRYRIPVVLFRCPTVLRPCCELKCPDCKLYGLCLVVHHCPASSVLVVLKLPEFLDQQLGSSLESPSTERVPRRAQDPPRTRVVGDSPNFLAVHVDVVSNVRDSLGGDSLLRHLWPPCLDNQSFAYQAGDVIPGFANTRRSSGEAGGISNPTPLPRWPSAVVRAKHERCSV